MRTPSRTGLGGGDRKLPDIPKEESANLYATVGNFDSEDDEDDDPAAAMAPSAVSLDEQTHPYAKVKKKKKKATAEEHPYATVKKSPESNGAVPKAIHDDLDDDIIDGSMLHPLNPGSRAGSGRSQLNHPVIGGSRQATPLPPEPPPSNINHPTASSLQQAHFSGDSQDSSKGYTSISVREPARHIHLPPPPPPPPPLSSRGRDATYATVSETSDDMYAAIEDPTYIPTGAASQSNSDTYAVIDLPPEENVAMDPSASSSAQHHTYSKVDKKKKKTPAKSLVAQASSKVEEMYAKVQKRTVATGDSVDTMPMGASAITQAGARPKIRDWDRMSKPPTKSEINYSDYEVSVYDKDKGGNTDDNYETVPAKSEEGSGYETVPDHKTSWKKPVGGITAYIDDSAPEDGGYETVPAAVAISEHLDDGGEGYEPDYWRSNASSGGGGYETVKDATSREPGYEVLRSNSGRLKNDDDDYDVDVPFSVNSPFRRDTTRAECCSCSYLSLAYLPSAA